MLKRLNVFIFLILIALVFPFGATADDHTHRAAVEKLLLLMNQDRLVEQMFPQMKQFIFEQMQQQDIPADQYPKLEKYFNQMFDIMQEELSWEKMKDDYIQIYTAVYTEEEINELIAFYESPIGQKMTAKMPQLVQESMQVSQKFVQNMMPKIQKLAAEIASEIQKE